MLYLRLFFLCLLVSSTLSASAQVVEDTTSIERYYPLRIGNEWRYTGQEASDKRHTIIGDTTFNNRDYFSIEVYVPVVAHLDTFYTRLDTSGAVVFVTDLLADTTTYPHPLPCDTPNLVFANCIDLGASFGDTLYYDSTSSTAYTVTGSYNESVNIGGIDYDGLTMKCFAVFRAYGTCFIADIGWYSGGSLESYTLNAAAVESGGWGTFLPDSIEEPEGIAFSVELYPNPTSESVSIVVEPAFQLQAIRIYNMLGQEVRNLQTADTDISMDVTSLSAGQYIVQVEGHRSTVERTFIKR